MPLINQQLREVWDALRAEGNQRPNALRAVRLKRLRGIQNLRVPFSYPVSVLAGPNGCGKSTVLFACACAYRDPERGTREFVPTSLFPNFVDPQRGNISDQIEHTELVEVERRAVRKQHLHATSCRTETIARQERLAGGRRLRLPFALEHRGSVNKCHVCWRRLLCARHRNNH